MTTEENRLNGMSDEAVTRGTGRDWAAWLRFLDDLGAQELGPQGELSPSWPGREAWKTAGGSSRWP